MDPVTTSLVVVIILLIGILVMRRPPPPKADCSEWEAWRDKVKDWRDEVFDYIKTCNCPGPDPGEPDPPPGGWEGE